MCPYLYYNIIYNNLQVEVIKCPSVDKWVRNMQYTHTHTKCNITQQVTSVLKLTFFYHPLISKGLI